MAEDAANEDAAPASASPDPAAKPEGARAEPASLSDHSAHQRPRSAFGARARARFPSRRTLLLSLGFLAPCVVSVVGIFFITTGARVGVAPTTASGSAAPVSLAESPSAGAAVAASEPASAEKSEAGSSVFEDESDDGEPKQEKRTAPKHFATVQDAAAGSCSTASVDGLSRQIIEQARCVKQNAFVPLPARPNLVLASHVFPFLELEARNHLLRALDAHPAGKMTINSALRTVAQQYLVSRWAAGKRCGVQLATAPGESNHELGIALDIAEAGAWRPALEAEEFRWLGASDRVHFDYKGGDTAPHSSTDVLAFQLLWNKNHPQDVIAPSGHYSPALEQRLKQAPPDGFALGPRCGKAGAPKR